jgi:hypothetical protein
LRFSFEVFILQKFQPYKIESSKKAFKTPAKFQPSKLQNQNFKSQKVIAFGYNFFGECNYLIISTLCQK